MSKMLEIHLHFNEGNKYLTPSQSERFLAPSCLLQCLAKVFGPLELSDLLTYFRLQTKI